MGRIACLGLDVHKLLCPTLPLVNFQKGRVDLLSGYSAGSFSSPSSAELCEYFSRSDIVRLVAQLEGFRCSKMLPPVALFMDSYAELTDQLFVERNQRQRAFCANYSDLNHSAEFRARYECRALLPLEELSTAYRRFFFEIRSSFGPIPIVFLHFPKDLEMREKFRARHDAIACVISSIAPEFSPFYSVALPLGTVRAPASTTNEGLFPYHYDAACYTQLADRVRSLPIAL